MLIKVVYNIKGIIHPLTDVVDVPTQYTDEDVLKALNDLMLENAPALHQAGRRANKIVLITPGE